MALIKRKNRRHGPDAVIKAINFLSALCWIMVFGIFIIFSLAKPRFQGFDRNMTMLGGQWDKSTLNITLYLMIFLVFLSVVGILFNLTRMKRKTDHLSKSLVISGFFAILGIIFYMVII